MRIPALFLLILAVGIADADVTQPESDFKLYLVRHAEKQTDAGKDPGLTGAGKFRADQLSKWFQTRDLIQVWSTDYRRTRDTAAPLVTRQDLRITLYDPHDLPALASVLLENRRNALIVGHSNTTPDLTRLLCQCDVSDMDESEYDLLFVVSVSGGGTQLEILKQSSLFEKWVRKE